MAPRSLYLYEVIDIVGQGQYEYMEHLWKDPVQEMPDMDKLQGSFHICSFGGGRWPQVVNIWDVGARGYTSWGFNVDRTNLKRRSAFYSDWWQTAYQWRTGGFDRLCAGVPGSPTTAELAEMGLRATLFVNEIFTVHPGSQLEFLRRVVKERVPLMRDYGHEPTGLYEVTSNQHEVVMVWATDVPSQIRFRKNRDTTRELCDEGDVDDRITAWDAVSARYVTGGDTHIMTPLPGTVYGPESWEDATLEQWYTAAEKPIE